MTQVIASTLRVTDIMSESSAARTEQSRDVSNGEAATDRPGHAAQSSARGGSGRRSRQLSHQAQAPEEAVELCKLRD